MDPNSSELELALNYSVLYYELKDDSSKACKIAEEALNGARDEIEKLTFPGCSDEHQLGSSEHQLGRGSGQVSSNNIIG